MLSDRNQQDHGDIQFGHSSRLVRTPNRLSHYESSKHNSNKFIPVLYILWDWADTGLVNLRNYLGCNSWQFYKLIIGLRGPKSRGDNKSGGTFHWQPSHSLQRPNQDDFPEVEPRVTHNPTRVSTRSHSLFFKFSIFTVNYSVFVFKFSSYSD